MQRTLVCLTLLPSFFCFTLLTSFCFAQDPFTGTLRGVVVDSSGARVRYATVVLTQSETAHVRSTRTDGSGEFTFPLLQAATYSLEVSATGFRGARQEAIKVEVGGSVSLRMTLQVAAAAETLTVSDGAPVVETAASGVSEVIDERAIGELPLNGRRFADLALLTPGVTQDPRGLTSSTSGDLAFGGVRGYNTTFLVDGADNNNGFFAQPRGRYRAPYQFSQEVIQEFRVSSNTTNPELGRSSGAVMNAVTKSGTNLHHGSIFYYLRDGDLAARHPFVRQRFPDKQHQFGGSIGGAIRRGKLFYFAAFDQHIFDVPTVVEFQNGERVLTPAAADFESTDQQLVFDAAAQLSQLAGRFHTALHGNTGFFKLDAHLTARHQLAGRVNISRFSGENNVFFDDASPITTFAISGNGKELVSTESVNVTLTSVFGHRWTSQLRANLARDDQRSRANSSEPATTVDGVISGFGRSSILPRQTRELRSGSAETVSYITPRHTLKFGVDLGISRIENRFPLLYGGRYIFDSINVNPFTFVPQTFGLTLTPLRAYAHQVPRTYSQNFGRSTSNPNSNDFAAFVQESVRVGDHLAVTVGLRYDRQVFNPDGSTSNPAWPDAGKLPNDSNNFAPRIGLAASIGDQRPLVMRGGYGIFFTRIPQIYPSTVAIENGINRQHLRLDNSDFFQRQLFPLYPDPLVSCGLTAEECAAPASVAGFVSTVISSFASNFHTPYVQHANLSLEKEVMRRTAIGASYLFVGGKHLIRARDVNLPAPVETSYPIFNDDGFTGEFHSVTSFSDWRFTPSLTCPVPPCIEPLQRPISSLGAINVFESAASSVYHGLTISAKRRLGEGVYFRLGYTWAHAADTGQDALVAGRPAVVENSHNAVGERGRSVTDQRHRAVFAMTADPRPFDRRHRHWGRVFNDWKFAGIFAAGSGRPITGRTSGDANRDGNFDNDRLPGARRNSFTGPDYFSTEARITRRFHLNERWRLEAHVEAFNALNRNNKRVDASDDGFASTSATFVPFRTTIGADRYAGRFQRNGSFLRPNNAYAPRQVQVSVRVRF